MKVLLVDDDVDLLDITSYALRREGFNVIAATDGFQALRRWATDQPDVVVLLKTHICHIRRKLKLPRGHLGDILALPGVGYPLTVPEAAPL